MNATVILLDGERVRVTLPEPHWEGRCEISTGIIAKALYSGRRTGRHFMQTYSIWDNGRGGNTGEQFRELEEADYLKICEKVDAEPVYVQIIDESDGRMVRRWMSAAPELLAALEQCLPLIDAYRRDSGGDGDLSAMAARAAIKKARGKSSC